MTETTPIVDSKHTDQSIPYEWTAYEARDETIVTHTTDSPTADGYRVAGVATNPDAIADAEAVLFEGSVLEPVENERLACIDLHHFHGGRMHSIGPDDEIEEPVVLLERLEHVDEPLAKYEAEVVDSSPKDLLIESLPFAVVAAVLFPVMMVFEPSPGLTVPFALRALLTMIYVPAFLLGFLGIFFASVGTFHNRVEGT